MFTVELTYRTKLGNLTADMTSAETVATREEANELREALQAIPELELATVMIKIKRAKSPPTVDEALDRFRAELRRFIPLET